MGTSELFDKYFQQVAKQAAQNKTTPTPSSTGITSSSLLGKDGVKTTGSGVEGAWSLGQGIIDFLSTGSYAGAGLGKGIGEAVQKTQRGDLFGGIGSIIGGPGQGIAERRTWSENLQDLGVSEADSAGWGLALDIAVDPLWLIPGGAIAAGIKGTSRGVMAGAAASRAGVRLNTEAFNQAGKRLAEGRRVPGSKEEAQRLSPLRDIQIREGKVQGPTADLYPTPGARTPVLGPEGIGNLYRGIMQGNAENYAEWAAVRKIQKAGRITRKGKDEADPLRVEKFTSKYGIDPFKLLAPVAKAADDVASDVGRAADSPTMDREIEDTVADVTEASEKAVKEQTRATTKTAVEKDTGAVQEAVDNALDQAGAPGKSTFGMARETVGPVRAEYLTSRGLPAPSVDTASLANVKTAKIAGEIADEYDRMISNPNDPQVIAAYKKLSEEVEDQYKFLTEEKGVKIEFVDKDPYVKTIDGVDVPDAQAMMKDVMDNNTLKVYKTADDQVHPILSKDINDKFRAVHDFFGHAASGRSFQGDGEEAAWISHSMMFSPLARRAMTTETRGQNSWVNKFGLDEAGRPFKFAEQKAGLLPDAYVALPSEYAALENVIEATNSLIGRSTAVLLTKADAILDELGMVAQPLSGPRYTPEDFASIKQSLEKVTDSEFVKPGSTEHSTVLKTLGLLKKRVDGGTRLASIAEDMIDLATKLPGNSANAFSKVLNVPTDATELITAAAAAEGRSLDLPKPFAPTTWSAKEGTYSKPPFTMEYLQRFFPNDQIFNDPKTLDLALGATPASTAGVRAIKGETKEQAIARKQSLIWEAFRSRNAEQLAEVEAAEKQLWESANSIAGSDLVSQAKSGLVGLGPMPLGLPSRIFTSHNGRPVTTLAQVLENLPAMIIREPLRMVRGTGGFETTISAALKKKSDVTRPGTQETEITELMFPEDEVIEFVSSSKISGAKFNLIDKNGQVLDNFEVLQSVRAGNGVPAGVTLKAGNKQAEDLLTRLKEIKPEIEIDRIQPIVKDWIVKKLDAATAAVTGKSIRVSKPVNSLDEASIGMMARKLMDDNPKIKSFADAEMLVAGFEDAMKLLATKPNKKLFVRREDLAPVLGERKQKVDRLRASGAVNPYGEKASRTTEAGGASFKFDMENADYTLLTESGSQFTGRAASRDKLNRKYQSQTGVGPNQLAAVSNVMKAIDTVAGAITSKELMASPEQAALLGKVLDELGVRVAPEATPKQIFQQFQKDASIAYRDLIQGIESAAKSEAVMHQAQKVFTMSIDENIAILEAVQKTDPGEVQRKVMQFTQNSVEEVNDTCRALFGRSAPMPTEFLDKTLKIGKFSPFRLLGE